MKVAGRIRTAWHRSAMTAFLTLGALSPASDALAQFAQTQLRGPYLGQTPPGSRPEIFAPGVVSTAAHEFSCSFTPDGRELYFTRRVSPQSPMLIMVSRMVNGTWTEPEPAAFNDQAAQMSFEPMVTPDGRRLYFSSDKPVAPQATLGGPPTTNTWYLDREGDVWSQPRNPGPPFNPMRSMYVTMTSAGTIYTTDISAGMGSEGIGVARLVGGTYRAIERLGAPINVGTGNMYPYIAPDEQYLVFSRRQGGPGGTSGLLVSFRNSDGSWGEPRVIDLGMSAGTPTVSHDGRYLFFSAGDRGRGDIYWVSAEVLRASPR